MPPCPSVTNPSTDIVRPATTFAMAPLYRALPFSARASASVASVLTREFRKLWIGQSISAVGSQVTLIALPLTAALSLGATPQQMGFLVAVQWLPYPIFGLFAGAWSDRLRRKPILIATDIGRAAVLVTV